MVVRASVAIAVGLIAGIALGWPVRPAGPVVVGDAEACQAQLDLEAQKYLELREQASRAERDLASARRRYAAASAPPRPWPEQPPSALAPERLRAHLDAALADLPASLLELDCEHYPCVASMAWEHQPEDDGLLDAGDGRANLPGRLLAEIQGAPPYDSLSVYFTGRLDPRGDGRSVFALSFFDTSDFTAAKGDGSAEQPDLQTSIVDQTQGRAEGAAERWAQEDF